MKGVALNTLFIILLAATLVLFTIYYILNSAETEQEFGGFKEITGKVQRFETLENSDCAISSLQRGVSNRNFRRAQKHAPRFSAGSVFDIPSDEVMLSWPAKKTTERYDDKFFEYLEGIQDSRDKTFMKGKVFLEEK